MRLGYMLIFQICKMLNRFSALQFQKIWGSDDGFLYCLDIDGKLIWKTKLNGKIRSSSPCLSFDDDQSSSLFIGTYNGGMFCLNRSTGVIKWNKQIFKPVMASPTTIKDKVFFATSDKRIYCFHVEDGSRIWQKQKIKYGHPHLYLNMMA